MKRSVILKTAGLLILVIAFAFAFTYEGSNIRGTDTVVDQNAAPASITVEGLLDKAPVSVSSDRTILNILKELDSKNASLRLATKSYKGLGTLVTSMNGMTNGTDNKYWQYRVNGVMPQIGADNYIPAPGDTIEWYFAASAQ